MLGKTERTVLKVCIFLFLDFQVEVNVLENNELLFLHFKVNVDINLTLFQQ